VSSSDLSLIDLPVATRDDVEYFACYVSFEAADRFEFGMALGYSTGNVFLGLRIKSQSSDGNDV